MTTDKVTIDRELLERLEHVTRNLVPHLQCHTDLVAALAAPRQPEGDGLEVVTVRVCGYAPGLGQVTVQLPDGEFRNWSRRLELGEQVQISVNTPDAQRAIAELREECERLRLKVTLFNDGKPYAALKAERDTLRQQLAEQDAEIERLRVKLMTIASAEPGRHNIEWAKAMAATGSNEAYAKWREAFDQRDKLAGLLREVRVIVAREVERWTRSAAIFPVNANIESGLLTRIDAALAEVKP